jgi:hypothetical protein
MLDFIFSSNAKNIALLETSIKSIYPDNVSTFCLKGDWGMLVCTYRDKSEYGYELIDSPESIFCLIGAPLYIDSTVSQQTEKKSLKINIKDIFEMYKTSINLISDCLNGPFSIIYINKKTKNIEVMTDLLSLIPIFGKYEINKCTVGSHIDVVAETLNLRNNYDYVSLTEFTINGRITYPYTAYKGVYQLPPSSIFTADVQQRKYTSEAYWRPAESNTSLNIDDTAEEISQALHEYCETAVKDNGSAAMMMSGGEDSRLILSILSNYTNVDSYIFLDSSNREGVIAQKACKTYDSNFEILLRSKSYYIDIHKDASLLVGLGYQYAHVHAYKFINNISENHYQTVFGGYLSDALLKGSRAEKYNFNKFGLYYDFLKEASIPLIDKSKLTIFNPQMIDEINNRRIEFDNLDLYDNLKDSDDWKGFYPSSTYKSSPFFYGHRRIIPVFEPYTATKIIKASAAIPLAWKLNRKLFQKIVKINLGKTKWLSHSDGHYPYFPWYFNLLMVPIVRVKRALYSIIGSNNDSMQGPWTNWMKLIESKEFKKIEALYGKDVYNNIFSIPFSEAIKSKHFTKSNRLSVLQILYQTSTNDKNHT